MKKSLTTIIALLLIVIMSVSLVGCSDTGASNTESTSEKTTQVHKIEGRFIPIAGNNLYYDYETFIVYYLIFAPNTSSSPHIPCPFYSENGYLCSYNPETGELSEIVH